MSIEKKKLAVYWAASCGGCDVSILNIHEHLIAVDDAFDIVFWPCAADFKYEDVRGYEDGYIDLCLFNGAIRNSENEELARLLRRKSKVLVAYGACACEGSIPALANFASLDSMMETVYADGLSTDNPDGILPRPQTEVPEGEIEIPEMHQVVRKLDDFVEVDYYIPGCPPESPQTWAVLQAIIQGVPLPPPGSVLGADGTAVCRECPLLKEEKTVTRFFRPYELTPVAGKCLLEQGLICMGPATRSGCGALCPQVGMGCRGCYGPVERGEDQGVRMLSALASILDVGAPGQSEEETEAAVDRALDTLVDPTGTFYRFSMASALLRRARVNGTSNGQLPSEVGAFAHHEEDQH